MNNSSTPPAPPALPPTQEELMMSGALFDANCPELSAQRAACRERLFQLNTQGTDEEAQRGFAALLGAAGDGLHLERPFHCDYGYLIHAGAGFYANCGCVMLDGGGITIGDRVLLGPGVHIYCASHPLDVAQRAAGLETARPVAIGDDVWIGGHSTILPGVTIGARAVVGAGSVVTRDVPADVVVAGSPAKVIRRVGPEADKGERKGE